jgi:hypothetical protein
MSQFNDQTYQFLENIFSYVEKLGLPLIILAWCSVFFGFIGMIFVLKRHSMRGRWVPSFVVGGIALCGHLLDFFITIHLCPDLTTEANPIWNVVVERLGLGIAKWYGFSGKVLLSLLSFQFFAYFLIQREHLLPESTKGLIDFWNRFGSFKGRRSVVRFKNIVNFFAFLFALSGPFYFYIVILNSITSEDLYMKLPSMPVAGFFYMVILTLVYIFGNYWAFRRRGNAGQNP